MSFKFYLTLAVVPLLLHISCGEPAGGNVLFPNQDNGGNLDVGEILGGNPGGEGGSFGPGGGSPGGDGGSFGPDGGNPGGNGGSFKPDGGNPGGEGGSFGTGDGNPGGDGGSFGGDEVGEDGNSFGGRDNGCYANTSALTNIFLAFIVMKLI